MGQQTALKHIGGLALAIALAATPALADDGGSISRIGVDLGPIAHSNQGRGGSYIEGEYQIPFAPGVPTKLKRIEGLYKIKSFTDPIGRDKFRAPLSSGLLGFSGQGTADDLSAYVGPSSYSTPVPAPGGIALALGAGLLAARRRR